MANSELGKLILMACLLLCGPLSAADPASTSEQGAESPKTYIWRGDGTGRFVKAAPPTEWDAEAKKNLRWSVKVGASKFTSPIIVGNKVFTVSDPADLLCIDAANGTVLWQKTNGFSELATKTEERIPKGSTKNTTPVPVSDGRFVYVSFGSGIVGCYDLDGTRQWLSFFDGALTSDFGRSASPVLAGDKLIVSIHHMIALDVKTGKVAWVNEQVAEKFGTPVAMTVGGLEILLAPSGHIVRVKDGQILGKIPELQYASPVINGSIAYFVGTAAKAIEFSANGADSVTAKELWTADLEGTFYASPVIDNGLLFSVSNEGQLYVINAADGKIFTTKDLEILSANGHGDTAANMYPSLNIAGPNLYLSNDAGETLVLVPGKEYKEIHKNKLPEGSGGTPAFAGRCIFVRDGENLFCLGEK